MRDTFLMLTYLLIASGLVLIVISVVFSLKKRAADPADATARLELSGDSFIDERLPADSFADESPGGEVPDRPTLESHGSEFLEPWASAETGAHTTIFVWIEAAAPALDGTVPPPPAPAAADAAEPLETTAEAVGIPSGGVLAEGSTEDLGIANLLEVAAAFQTAGFLQLDLPGHRIVTAHFAEGCLTSLTDTGRVWRLGDLLGCLGRLSDDDREHLLAESEARGVALGRLVLDDAYLPSAEVETFLRRLAMHSLLLAVENQAASTFHVGLEETFRPTVMLPIGDFVRELRPAGAQLERLRGLLGRGGGSLGLTQNSDPAGAGKAPDYRQVEVLAQVDGEKTPMELAASSPLPPAETLAILCDLAERGLIGWAPSVEAETATDFEFRTVATG
ncbi:MAG: hypothetical protein MUQ56_12635 [Thermoleophilia bacterium]|nr:hypothetical protein [Thermoleophilia bacterium]